MPLLKLWGVFLQGSSTDICTITKIKVFAFLGSISLWDMAYFMALNCTLNLSRYDLLLQIEVKTLSRRNDSR